MVPKPFKTVFLAFIAMMARTKSLNTALALTAVIAVSPMASYGFDLDGTSFDVAAHAAGVDPYLLYSVAITESGWAPSVGATHYGPWPWSVRVNKPKDAGPDFDRFAGGHRFDSREEAIGFINDYLAAGHNPDNIDIGLMQISYLHHSELIETAGGLENVLVPQVNLNVGAEILRTALASSTDPELSVGRYHNWYDDIARDYAKKVFTVFNKISRLRLSNINSQ